MDRLKLRRRIIIISLLLIISSFLFALQKNEILFYPGKLNVVKGEDRNLNISFPFSLDYKNGDSKVQTIYNEGSKSYNLNGLETGEEQLKLKLLGVIPLKT